MDSRSLHSAERSRWSLPEMQEIRPLIPGGAWNLASQTDYIPQ